MVFSLLGKAATVAGIVGAAYGIYGYLAFEPVASYQNRLSMCGPDVTEWSNFAQFLDGNNREVVLLDVIVDFDAGLCATEQSRRLDRNNDPSRPEDQVLYTFSSRFGNAGPAPHLFPDNGLAIVIQNPALMPNRLTQMQLGVEGLEDRIAGPLQVAVQGEDAGLGITLTPPNLNDSETQRIACTRNGWGRLQMALMCPFTNP